MGIPSQFFVIEENCYINIKDQINPILFIIYLILACSNILQIVYIIKMLTDKSYCRKIECNSVLGVWGFLLWGVEKENLVSFEFFSENIQEISAKIT